MAPRGRLAAGAGIAVLVAGGATAAVLATRGSPSPASERLSALPTASASALAPGQQSVLHAVACGAPSFCVATGAFSGDGATWSTLVESWNGSLWSVVSSPSPGTDTELESVACSSPRACVAVGFSGAADRPDSQRPLAERWNGATWTVMHVPGRGTHSALQAVACASATSCTAVGASSSGSEGLAAALVASWDGRAWSILDVPLPPDSADSWLDAVACSAPASCMAVGSYSTTGDGDDPAARTLVESWNGRTWSVTPSPSPGTGNQSLLRSIACTSPSACIAVGVSDPKGDPYHPDDQALVEAWNGADWSVVPAAALGDAQQHGALQSIACMSAARCVAVGTSSRGASSPARGLEETWDGVSWALVSAGAAEGGFESVACTSPVACLAVGQGTAVGGAGRRTLAQWLPAST